MKTTVLNKNNMLRAIKGSNGSLIIIDQSIVNQAISAGLLHKIAERSGNKNTNIYYEIVDDNRNDVLMHVQNDMYVLISRYVYCIQTGEMLDAINYLLRFSFNAGRTGSNRCHVMAYCPDYIRTAGCFNKTVYLTRLLTSLERYGTLLNLRSEDDIHHKGDCFDNRQGMIIMVPSVKHTHRESHMTGFQIQSYEEFKKFIVWINAKFQAVSKVTEIA